MSFDLTPITAGGAALDEIIRALIPTLRERAGEADRRNEMCAETYRTLQESGITAAFVPTELGGLGVESMHDWIVAIASLARGDGSVAIALCMHFTATRGMAARLAAASQGSTEAQHYADMLRRVAAGDMLVCSTTTERGNDNLHPHTEATRTEDGWSVSGRKYFVTMSPLATHIGLNVRMRDKEGDHIANVLAPMDTAGIYPQDDWDALGMRASGSQSVKLEDCRVPHEALRIIGPWGRWSIPVLLHRTLANVPLVAAFLGIAEHAYEIARSRLADTERSERGGVQHTMGEMEIAIATCQCMLGQIGRALDAQLASTEPLTWARGHELMKDYQSVKWVVNRHAIDIVSRAMDLAGGGGYAGQSPLTRLYRDVRAGPFMQPHSPVDAREYVGQVALGRYPEA